MIRLLKYFTALILALGLCLPAVASSVFLVGDSNIFRTDGDNELLMQNIFNGQMVLNSTPTNGNVSLSGLGTTATVSTGSITDANLLGKDFLLTGYNRTSYSLAERASITSFVSGGGSLFLVGEGNNSFVALNTSLNTILTDIGSTLFLGLTSTTNFSGNGLQTGLATATPYATGVSSYWTSFASQVNLGANGLAVVSANPSGSGFEVNVAVESLSPVPVPAAIWLFGTALIGFVGMSRRRKVA